MSLPHRRKNSTWGTKISWLNSPPFLMPAFFILRRYAISLWKSLWRTSTEPNGLMRFMKSGSEPFFDIETTLDGSNLKERAT